MDGAHEPAWHLGDWCERFVRKLEDHDSSAGRTDLREVAFFAYLNMNKMIPELAALEWANLWRPL